MAISNEYLFGKGRVAFQERDVNGAVSELYYIGNCPEFKISGTADRIKHYESESGANALDRNIVKTSELEFSITLENWKNANLALMLWGTETAIATAATQSYFFPSGIVNNDIHAVPNGFNITNAVVKDSAGTPATVTNTKYTLDVDLGTITFLDVAGYTQPFEIEYDRGAATSVPLITTTPPSRFLRFEGQNLGNPGLSYSDKFLVELYICQFDLPTDLSFIGDDFAKFELKGALQADDTRSSNSALGSYGRIVKV